VTSSDSDTVFGFSRTNPTTTTLNRNTNFKVFRVKVSSAVSDLRAYKIFGPSGLNELTCNSIRAVSDSELFMNIKVGSTDTLILYKIIFNELDATAIAFEHRFYRPTLITYLTSDDFRSFILPPISSTAEPEILFGGSDPWSLFADKI